MHQVIVSSLIKIRDQEVNGDAESINEKLQCLYTFKVSPFPDNQ